MRTYTQAHKKIPEIIDILMLVIENRDKINIYCNIMTGWNNE